MHAALPGLTPPLATSRGGGLRARPPGREKAAVGPGIGQGVAASCPSAEDKETSPLRAQSPAVLRTVSLGFRANPDSPESSASVVDISLS